MGSPTKTPGLPLHPFWMSLLALGWAQHLPGREGMELWVPAGSRDWCRGDTRKGSKARARQETRALSTQDRISPLSDSCESGWGVGGWARLAAGLPAQTCGSLSCPPPHSVGWASHTSLPSLLLGKGAPGWDLQLPV